MMGCINSFYARKEIFIYSRDSSVTASPFLQSLHHCLKIDPSGYANTTFSTCSAIITCDLRL